MQGSIAVSLRFSYTRKGQRQTVRFLFTDDPSEKLYAGLKDVLPNLEVVACDTTHLAMTYEYATWRKRTEGSRLLRRIMAKFNRHDPGVDAAAWGPPFNGSGESPLDRAEELCRERILDGSMPQGRALAAVAALDDSKPWYARFAFIEALAALAALHPEDMRRKVSGANKPLSRLLWSAAAPKKVEWYWNCMRVRHSMDRSKLELLPSGTTSNESLHHEINSWFRQTPMIHSATLSLKFAVQTLQKLMTHNAALYRPTARGMAPMCVRARVLGCPLWTSATWRTFCAGLRLHGRIRKASLPLYSERQGQVEVVRKWLAKRPAASERRPVKRTAFNLVRAGNFRKGGVKTTVFKKPARV